MSYDSMPDQWHWGDLEEDSRAPEDHDIDVSDSEGEDTELKGPHATVQGPGVGPEARRIVERREGATRGEAIVSKAEGAGTSGDGVEEGMLQPNMMKASKKGVDGRIKFEHEGRTVFEWEQSLEEVNLYIKPPPGVTPSMIDCKIGPRHLRLGIKGNPPFIDEDTGGPLVVEESYWMMDGEELNVNLQKMKKAETWVGPLAGRESVDPATLQGMQKKIMLERFQAENPGFDFSNAEFNGQVPDARTFMGGVRYT